MSFRLLLALLCLGAAACKPKLHKQPLQPTDAATRPAWLPEKPAPIQPGKTRHFRLLHTTLELRPDWARRELPGTATLTLVPWFRPQDTMVLDAKCMHIHAVNLLQPTGPQQLPYHYDRDSLRLHIALGDTYSRTDTLRLSIRYTARPQEVKIPGSESIADARGLYFINADRRHPLKPTQLWTQGQPESASCWFPTLDDPAQRCTQELHLTVPDSMRTLSNGLLVHAAPAEPGWRTDTWRLDLPHPPYLFMIAAGNFVEVADSLQQLPVTYFVEPQFAPHARMVFGRTPEMIAFFSQLFDFPYPWPKYSQIVVRDFVSGAMENTTATVHNSDLQHDARQHLDDTEEDYISHELFHQWFGNVVTCESWAQLTLNEGLTTYGEYLWREYKYGKAYADVQFEEALMGYLQEAEGKREPVVRHRHNNPGDMFDNHSYAKGGCILHLLRQYMGDDAFFEGLRLYLKTNAYQSVELPQLRMAFEAVLGEDLNWFFDQWFLMRGHPELVVTYGYDWASQQVEIRVKQTQDLRYQPIYRLHFLAEVQGQSGTQLVPLMVHTADTTLRIPYPRPEKATRTDKTLPDFIYNVDLDSRHTLVGTLDEEKPGRCWVHQLDHATQFGQSYKAITQLAPLAPGPQAAKALWRANRSPHWHLRLHALESLEAFYTDEDARDNWRDSLMAIYYRDPRSDVRGTALRLLTDVLAEETPITPAQKQAALKCLRAGLQDSSYSVVSHALIGLSRVDTTHLLALAMPLADLPSEIIQQTVAELLLAKNHPTANDYIIRCLWRIPGYGRLFILNNYLGYLSDRTDAEVAAVLPVLQYTAEEDPLWFMRYTAARVLTELAPRRPDLKPWLKQLKARERDPKLKALLSTF
jgi:aminopeptidase N